VTSVARTVLDAWAPGGAAARLSVLIFHRVPAVADPLFPGETDARHFDRICALLARWFRPMALEQASRALADNALPPRALAITFDDGYADNHDVALPILRRHGLPATFFVATGYLNGGRMWNDTIVEAIRRTPHATLDMGRAGLPQLGPLPVATLEDKRKAVGAVLAACKYLPGAQREQAAEAVGKLGGAELPNDLMMSSEQVMAMHRAGMAIGGHTVRHPILATLPPAEARREMQDGKRWLENLIQQPVRAFAYPNGRPGRDYTAEHVALVREAGFDVAVSTAPGAGRKGSDPHQLPRFTPWDRAGWAFGMRLARNLRSAEEARA
jgi:peptidoglycan/xylan/chitin deacetylase (PgdA/CDA1 family)